MALIGHWPLNGNLDDYSGYGKHGSVYGTLTSSTAGKIGLTYIFENNENGVDISNNNFSGLTSYTMSAWINPAGNHRNYNGTILSSGNWNGTCWAFGVNQTNTAIDAAGRGYNKYINYTFTLNTWTHILSVVSNGVSKVYVNGNYLGQINVTSTLASDATNTFIGRETYAGGHFSFNGKINDVRIYDHALTDAEIQEIHRAKIVHYSFNDPNIEPTINLFSHREPRIDPTYSKYTYTTNGTWLNKHPNAIRVYSRETNGEITGFVNGGVSDPTNSYHAVWEYDNYLKKPVVVQNDVDGSWKAYSFGIGKSMNSMGLSVGDYYTISWDQWVDDLGKETWGFLHGQNGSGSNGFHDSIVKSRLRNTSTRTWQRMYATFQVSSNWNLSANLTMYLYGYNKRGVIKMANLQMEAKDHPTPFVWNSRSASQINDISGFNNHAIFPQESRIPKYSENSIVGNGSLDFSGDKFFSIPNRKEMVTEQITVSAWAYRENWNQTSGERIISNTESGGWQLGFNDTPGYLVFQAYLSNNSYITPRPPGVMLNTISPGWHLVTGTFDGRYAKFYLDGELKETNDTGSIKTIKYNSVNNTFIGAEPTSNTTNPGGQYWTGLINDVRIYATALTDKEIKDLYDDRAEILNSGTLQTYDFKQRRNLLQSVNQAIKDKQFKDGLSSYTQGNTNVTLTDNGYRIYRTPNVNPTDNGNTMWGGLRINMADIPGGIPLTKGRSYRLIINTNGKTSNPANGSSKFTNSMGWGGGGLNPTPITIGREWVQIPSNFNGKHDIIWEFKIEDDIYKVCTSSYSSFVAGNTYPSYNHLQLGWGYQNTGSEGTEIYIVGIHLYDITDDDSIGISNKGIGTFDEYSTVGITDGLVGYYPLNKNANDYSGNNNNGAVIGAVNTNGLVDGAYSFNYTSLDRISLSSFNNLNFREGLTISAFIKSNDITKSQNIVSRNGPYFLRITSSTIRCAVLSGTWAFANGSIQLQSNQWYHVVLTYDQNKMRGYVNGVLDVDVDKTGLLDNATDHLFIGYTTASGEQSAFDGIIDEVKLFNRALTPEEIAIEYNTMFNNEVQIHESGVLYAKDLKQY